MKLCVWVDVYQWIERTTMNVNSETVKHIESNNITFYICIFIHSFIYSFIHSYIHSFIYSFIHSFIYSFIHSFTRLFVNANISPSIYSILTSGFPFNTFTATYYTCMGLCFHLLKMINTWPPSPELIYTLSKIT